MTTTFTIINIILMAATAAVIVGFLAWAIATQSRDDGPIQGALARRRRADRPAHVDRPLAGHSKSRRGQRRSVEA